ncbi:MAG: sigma-54 dependent transcriptional regulator [Gammaproteobacteria bacterium]|nr:sigma-54 dependent transcriptional regulator [Gammaproteobacteria bacterium]
MVERILVADDDKDVLAAIELLLDREQMEALLVGSPAEAVDAVKTNSFAAALLDLNFSLDTTAGQEGIALIDRLKALDETLPIIVMTGWGTVSLATQAMQAGAADFVEKPWENERLVSILRTQIALGQSLRARTRLSGENELLRAELLSEADRGFIAESPSMRRLLETLGQIATSRVNILLTGENGTGKSLLARYIHHQSARSAQPFIVVNMGSISESLFESEMFGHVKGAFTDAKNTRIGRFELADGGTLFLDEIGNIPLTQQAKLLTVLEDCRFEKVGSSRTDRVDVRVISATNANIDQMISDQVFRKDLLYRLNTVELEIPPLRERSEDIPLLAEHFVRDLGRQYDREAPVLSAAARQVLVEYAWPGNVRELHNVLERAVILSQDALIEVEHLMLERKSASEEAAPTLPGAGNFNALTMDEIERQEIIARIAHFGGNMKEAAQSLGMSRSAFYRRIEKFQL